MYRTIQSQIRKKILKMAIDSKEGHIASSFSIIEILISIYKYLDQVGASEEFCERVILSKGHAVFGLYALMSQFGLLSDDEFDNVCQYGSYLIGHVPVKPERNFFTGTGSLGQGFPMALGKAYAGSRSGDTVPQFVIIGDGELNEGSCWETLLLMKKFPNVGLRVFIDNNLSSTRAIPMEEVLSILPNCWKTIELDGHDIEKLIAILNGNENKENLVVICNTVKGFPLKNMIGNPMWHHKTPSQSEVDDFCGELDQFFGA